MSIPSIHHCVVTSTLLTTCERDVFISIGTENTSRPQGAGEGAAHEQSTAVASFEGGEGSSSSSHLPTLNATTGAVLPASATSSSSNATAVATGSSSSFNNNNKLDPGVLDAIMGKSDAQRMLEAVRDLKSQGQFSLEQKITIWDELELVS